VTFDVVCSLAFPHAQSALTCEYLTEWMCKPSAEGREPLPLPVPVPASEDYLVIGRITIKDGVFRQTYENRRPLFPVSLLQDWMMACLCAVKPPPVPPTPGPVVPEPPDPPVVVVTPTPPVLTPVDPDPPVLIPIPVPVIPVIPVPVKPIPEEPTWGMFNERAVANGLDPVDTHVVRNQERLAAAGIDRPGKLLSADLDQVSIATGLSKPTLEVMRRDIEGKRFLMNAPHI
jgi:hypothetical protein